MDSRRGVTLLELMIVVVLLGILFGFAVPHIQEFVAGSRRAKALADLDLLRQSATKYNFATETPIDRLAELEGTYVRDVKTLRDPWGNAYRLDTTELLVYSCGANGRDERGRGDDLGKRYRVPAYVIRVGNRNSLESPDSPSTFVKPSDDDAGSPLTGGERTGPLTGR